MDLLLGNWGNKLCSFFFGDSRPGAFVVADMCMNLLVGLAGEAVLWPGMEVDCNRMRKDCSHCLDSRGWQCFLELWCSEGCKMAMQGAGNGVARCT